jgi:hypothetical protein
MWLLKQKNGSHRSMRAQSLMLKRYW